jgi:amino acid adenylation domain-containing protein
LKPNVSSIDPMPGAANGGNAGALADNDSRLGPRLIAAMAVLVRRYTDQAELALGYVTEPGASPRRLALAVGDDPCFADLLGRVSASIAESDQRRDESLGSRSDQPGGAEQFDAVVAIDVEPQPPTQHGLWLTARTAKGETRLVMHCESTEESERMLGHLQTVLASAASDPSRSIDALDLVTEPELEQLITQWNDTQAPYPYRCLDELIAEQAERTPAAIAVQFGSQQLTYAELDGRADQLAQHLIKLGVGTDVLVGICVDRSAEMLVGLLGILKAGGAYVPIDPAYPSERQEFMLASSGGPVVLTQDRLIGSLPLDNVHVVCLDRDWPEIALMPERPPSLERNPDQLAYVIYTSGSTGEPKGVQISHRALVNFLTTMRELPGLGPADVLLAVTTLSFDIAGLELYLPLITGARVVIATSGTASDPRALADLLERSAATVMQATPTTWRMLIDSGWRGRSGMKALCGGEALPLALADSLVGIGLELWNMYGPTETTIWSTCAPIQAQGEPLTIGRPIANTTIYILDRNLRAVPVGVAGELWIGGDGLARGYRGRPDLTEERFIPHPFDASDGARIYRTGDLARYRNDGQLDFLGRIDHQVKVRGYRIELGEIENVLTRHPKVHEAIVVARTDSDGAAELAAYVIARGGDAPAHELREFLGHTLPAYMVPLTVTSLDSFPLTPNGKIDRKVLPEPTRERSTDHELVSPRTPLERQLAAIWERELGIRPVGVTDNFFDLGVTSIVAATLFASIEHELGNSLPLGAIFRAPTIESLAGLLETGGDGSRWTSLIPIQPEGSQPPIFCIHGGAGTILHLEALARRLGSDQPFYGLQSKGLYGGAAPLRTVEDMAAHYLAEMHEVHPDGPWRLGGYCFGSIVAFEIAQRLVAAGEQVELVAIFNGPSPAWIKHFGWYGGQPSWRAKHAIPPRPSDAQRRRHRRRRRLDSLLSLLRRAPRALRQPRRMITGLEWYTRSLRTRVLLTLGRPVPEQHREQFFVELHSTAERAYDASPYPGKLLIFRGEGLYDDPTLGWEGLATYGIQPYAVPGEHDSNRKAMHEPAVAFVSDRIQEYLSRDNH